MSALNCRNFHQFFMLFGGASWRIFSTCAVHDDDCFDC
jgi:hypothetical protein